MRILDEPVCRSHQVYLCHTSLTIFEGGANKGPPVPVRHTRRLCAWGRVADQAAHQGASFDNARNAIPNALRDVLWREIQSRGAYVCTPGLGECGGAGGGLSERLWGVPLSVG